MSEKPRPPGMLHCSGFNADGWTCRRTVLTFRSEDEEHGVRHWCSDHKPIDAERWDAHSHVEEDPDRRCVGFRRDGEPCRSSAVISVTFGGAEHRLCGFHLRVWEEHGTLQAPPKNRNKRPPIPALSDREVAEQLAARLAANGVELPPTASGDGVPPMPPTASGDGVPPNTTSPAGMHPSIRRRVEGSAELLYGDIEDALRRALRSATKERHVRCPECSKGFKVRIPDYAASVSAAKALLEIVVGRPKPHDVPPPVDVPGDVVDVKSLSTAQLRELARSARIEAERERSEES